MAFATACGDKGKVLAEASRDGDVDAVRRMLKADSHLSDVQVEIDGVLTSPLSEAVMAGHAKIVDLLIENGARVEDATEPIESANFESPLVFAVSQGHLDVIRALAKGGVDLGSQPAGNGKPALHVAVEMIYETGRNEKTKARYEMLRALLELGADPDGRDEGGATPLHYAARYGLAVAAAAILEHGAGVDTRDNARSTPLMYAAGNVSEAGDAGIDAVQRLVAAGADVNAVNDERDTPLSYAVRNAQDDNPKVIETIELFVGSGAEVNAETWNGRTALHIAAGRGYPGICTVLISMGADPNAADVYGENPLVHIFSASSASGLDIDGDGAAQVVEVLCRSGADPNARSYEGVTPLQSAAVNDLKEIARVLLDGGANPDERGYDGETALHEAAARDHIEIIEMLIEAGAQVDSEDDYGCTPLIEAAKNGRVAAADTLVRHGADIMATDVDGKSALDWAVESESEDLCELLKSHLN